MSRYIDADALIDAHYEYMNEHSYEWDAILFSWSESLMKNAPSIELIHCKECEYRNTFKCWMRNTQVPRYPNDEDYCSKGCREEKTCDTCKYNGVPSVECDRCDKTSYSRWVSRSEKANNSTISKMEQVGKE